MVDNSEGTLTTRLTLREAGGDVIIRQIPLGYTPVILIEPVDIENDEGEIEDVELSLDATGMDEEGLIILLEGILETLRNGVRNQ